MKKIFLSISLVLAAGLCAQAAAPNLFTYQGRLKEGGTAVTGNRTVEIFLCDAETGPTCTTTLAQPVAVANGLFRSTFTIPAAVNFGTGSWWLEIKVGADTLAPRERLTANAYALFAATAAYAENVSAAAGSDGVYVSSNLFISGNNFTVGGSTLAVDEGKVGIGTLNPAGALEIYRAGSGQTHLVLNNPSSDVALFIKKSSLRGILGMPYYDDRVVLTNKSAPFPGTADPAITLWDDGHMDLKVYSTGYINLTGGNVGISSSTPGYRLVVSSGAGEAGTMLVISTGSSNVIRMTGAGEIYANYFSGDGSQLTNLPAAGGAVAKTGDTMTGQLTISGSSLTVAGNLEASTAAFSGDVTAARYQINGSTVLAVLPGLKSLAVGIGAGDVSQGNENTFTGYQAGAINSSGGSNSFYGALAGANNAGGNNNSFFGAYSGNSNSGGLRNSFFGLSAGFSTNAGNDNAFFGTDSGRNNTGGSNNAAFGAEAAKGAAANVFSGVVAVGYQAGLGLTTGSDNIFIGRNAGDTVSTGNNNIIIGAGQDTSAAGASDELNVGGVLHGNLSAGRIGIGAAAPDQKLTVAGNISQTGVLISSGTGNNYFAGRVGVSTAIPDVGLHVYGADSAAATIKVEGAANSYLNLAGGAGAYSGLQYYEGGTLRSGIGWQGTDDTLRLNAGGGDNLVIDVSGRTGIGLVTPDQKLTVAGNISQTGVVISSGAGNNYFAGNVGVGIASPNYKLDVQGGSINASSSLCIADNCKSSWASIDNLGDHTATTDLNLAQNDILNVSSITIYGSGILIGTEQAGTGGGVFISTGGAIQTAGIGHGTVAGNARGRGAVDLQTKRQLIDQVASGIYSAITGGVENKASGPYAAISGGYGNTANQTASFVGSGMYNTANGNEVVVVGGTNNTATGDASFVGSGNYNRSVGAHSAIAGGEQNNTGGAHSAVAGGKTNHAGGMYGAVPGGFNNTADGNYSFAAGAMSSSTAQGAFTWHDSGGATLPLLNNVTDRTVFKNRGGFLVTGSTNTIISPTVDRGVFMTGDGLLGVAIAAPGAALDVVSTGSAVNNYAQIWRASDGTIVSSMTATGVFYGTTGSGDNLGNHTASQDLYLDGNHIYTVSTIAARGDITAASYQISGSTVLSVLGGVGNLGIGVNAGRQNTQGYNVFAGYGAGSGDTLGSGNVMVGYTAGGNNSGDFSTMIGYMAGFNNAGNYNSFMGYAAGSANTTGNNNLAIGNESAYYNKIGSANTLLGIGSGRGVLNNSFSSSTLAGYHAGYGLTTGNDNILIGFQAGDNLQTGSGNIIIGYDLDATAPTISNEIRIGNILYGNMTTGGVAIGAANTLPTAALDVKSTGTAANVNAQVWRDSNAVVVASMTATGHLETKGWSQRVQQVSLSGTATTFAADGSGIVLITQTSDTNNISTIAGCDSGVVAQGQQVLFVVTDYIAGSGSFVDTAAGSAVADNLILGTGFSMFDANREGSAITLLCTTINSVKAWVEVSASQKM